MSFDDNMLKEVEAIRLECPDINGISRGLLVDVDYFKKHLVSGMATYAGCLTLGCDGSVTSGTGLDKEDESPNGFLYPVCSTLQKLPWKLNVASVISNWSNLDCSTRSLCERQISRLNELGLHMYGAFEYEFYTLTKDTQKPVDETFNLNSTQFARKPEDYVLEIMRYVDEMGITPETFRCEFGPTQNEITISPSWNIDVADQGFRFKQTVKEISEKNGFCSTFMTRLYANDCSSCGHFNFSLWNDKKQNLFSDLKRENKLSELAEHCLAGLMYHTRAMTALFLSTANCYESVREHAYMPVNNTWGMDNRTTAYRVKSYNKSETYVENRIPGAAANPYLVVAANIIAVLDGIQKKMKLEALPFQGDGSSFHLEGYSTIPTSLDEALTTLQSSKLFRKELGEGFLKAFSAVKHHEIKLFENAKRNLKLNEWYREFYCESL